MPRKKKEDDVENKPLERILEMIDEEAARRGEAVLDEADSNRRLLELCDVAQRKGASAAELGRHARKMDIRERKLKPITRQAMTGLLERFDRGSTMAEVSDRARERALEMHASYLEGNSMRNVGKIFGVTEQTVSQVFGRYGLETRNSRRPAANNGRVNVDMLR